MEWNTSKCAIITVLVIVFVMLNLVKMNGGTDFSTSVVMIIIQTMIIVIIRNLIYPNML